MIENPFQDDVMSGHYTDKISRQVEGLAIGDSCMADMLGKDAASFRMTLRYVAARQRKKFKTKKDANGNLWVMRSE